MRGGSNGEDDVLMLEIDYEWNLRLKQRASAADTDVHRCGGEGAPPPPLDAHSVPFTVKHDVLSDCLLEVKTRNVYRYVGWAVSCGAR